MIGSRPVVGSSKKMISGSAAMARARPDAFLHPPRQLGRVEIGDFGAKPDAAQFLDRDGTRRGLGALQPAAQQPERDILPDGHGIEQRRTLEQHAEAGKKRVAVARGRILPIDPDGAGIGAQQPQNALQQHRLAGARAADDHHAFAARNRQVDAAQHRLGPEGPRHASHLDHRGHAEKNTPVRT
jgi:hypothetical protein